MSAIDTCHLEHTACEPRGHTAGFFARCYGAERAWGGGALLCVGREVTLARKEHNIIGLVLSGKEVVDMNPDILECPCIVRCMSLFVHRTDYLGTCDLYNGGGSPPFGIASW